MSAAVGMVSKSPRVALIGNPNSGKTSVFNALTGARQRVGNWPGVTVERKSGYFNAGAHQVEVVDLPGIYSLSQDSSDSAVDEQIACDYLLSGEADLLVNVIDASNLERNLYLTTQLLELGIPMVCILNMTDTAHKRGLTIDAAALSARLNCPVVPLQAAKRGADLRRLKQIITTAADAGELPQAMSYPAELAAVIALLQAELPAPSQGLAAPLWRAVQYLEAVTENSQSFAPTIHHALAELGEEPDILIADARYQYIARIVSEVLRKSRKDRSMTHHIDKVVMHRFWGIPIFLGMMYLMFVFAINVGGAFQDFFDISSSAIFIQGFGNLLAQLGTPAWLTAILTNGFGTGINTTVTFIPVIGALFLFLSFLEDCGYMARAAFVMDKGMRAVGLPGKAFVPMIVGFGCNVPAIMAARTLENRRDRVLTIMMSPFMSCGARLAIFAVFVSAFFPQGGHNIVFALYVIGILVALLTGFMLRKTILQGEPSPMVMELPPYHLPTLRALAMHTWFRLKNFIFKAGKVIIPICMLIGALNAINVDGSLSQGDASDHSLLSAVGRATTPVFHPMGLKTDNWPATVGLLTGVLAKEVVVATLNTLYTQSAHLRNSDTQVASVWDNLHAAVMSVPQNLAALGSAMSNPVLASASIETLNDGVMGQMYARFDGKTGAFAYLLFVLLYFPCVSATAAMTRELSRRWTVFSVLWTTCLAYAVAVTFYQLATWQAHPMTSLAWVVGVLGVLYAFVCLLKRYAHASGAHATGINVASSSASSPSLQVLSQQISARVLPDEQRGAT